MIPPMPHVLLAALTIAAPAHLLEAPVDPCGNECIVQVADLCVYEVPYPPFFEVRECDDEEVQSLKLG